MGFLIRLQSAEFSGVVLQFIIPGLLFNRSPVVARQERLVKLICTTFPPDDIATVQKAQSFFFFVIPVVPVHPLDLVQVLVLMFLRIMRRDHKRYSKSKLGCGCERLSFRRGKSPA
jgi:hypothetical protein